MTDMNAVEQAKRIVTSLLGPAMCSRETPALRLERIKYVTAAITVAVEAERAAWHTKLIEGLTAVYDDNGVLVAKLCDEHFDRSGALLGKVRDAAIEARKEKQ